MKKKIIWLVAFSLIANSLLSQLQQDNTKMNYNDHTISLSVDLGVHAINFMNPFEKAFNEQFFNAEYTSSLCFLWQCFGSFSTQYPHSGTDAFIAIDAGYMLNQNREIGLRTTITNKGQASGFHQEFGKLDISYQNLSFTPYYRFIDPSGILKLDLGLSANFLKIKESYSLNPNKEYSSFTPGISAGASIGILQRTNYHLSIGGIYNGQLGKMDIGPFDTSYYVNEQLRTSTSFQKKEVNMHSLVIYVSLGLRV